MKRCIAKRVTTSTTTGAVTGSCTVDQLVISINATGTNWHFKLQDRSTPNPIVLVPDIILSASSIPGASVTKFDQSVYMSGGIDIVTTGASPGEVAVWINFQDGS